ncbi:hypothetical protein [Actinomycetospora atypica]|uniref:Uncharacterized protein n=1 Tax=Actinomycetospora atypica TaxID=1290095 RepID=A0ABV9YQ54_9PSEU
MSDESWLPPPPVSFDGDHDDHEHHRHQAHHHPDERGLQLGDQVRSRYGRGIAVGDLLSHLDYRVNELHAAFLEPDRHTSRVPGAQVRMSGLDAVLNTDAHAWRTLTELGDRLGRVEQKLDTILERLPQA